LHSDLNIVPPLEDIVPGYDLLPVGARDGFEEQDQEEEPAMEQNLLDSVEAMQMEQSTPNQDLNNQIRTNQQEPIIQFPEEEYQPVDQTNIYVHPQVMEQMRAAATSSRTRTATGGPNSSDMIPPMRGLSNLQVSFGSAADVEMLPADRVLGKRAAGEEEEVQGQRLELSLGLNYGGQKEEHNQKKERKHHKQQNPSTRPGKGALEGQSKMKATGHVKAAKQARPHVWTRQEK
jgi:hypothetical protein